MKKAWSISTTVRNPDRILPFLETLADMAGQPFDEAGQILFQTRLIQRKLYKPEGLPADLLAAYDSSDEQMNDSQAAAVFAHMLSRSEQLQASPGLRGRTSVAPLTKMGLAIAKQSEGPVVITDFGQAFLGGQVDIGEVYFKFFLKWQIPTPGSSDFADTALYDIKPFIGVLQLIARVNALAAAQSLPVKGLSKAEFCLFAPTLVNAGDIETTAQEIIRLRQLVAAMPTADRRQTFTEQSRHWVAGFLGTTDPTQIEGMLHNLRDYGDNALRYFRLTRYVYIRGGGHHIDLEPRRQTELSELLKLSAHSDSFTSPEAYAAFMADSSQPALPWEVPDKLRQIFETIRTEIQDYQRQLDIDEPVPSLDQSASSANLKDAIASARQRRRELQEQLRHQAARSLDALQDYTSKLQSIYELENRPIQLEKYVSLGLHALNDALRVQPNYPVGDDNEPTFTAPANVPDIECLYATANVLCEVTMLTSRDQYYNESQPVMRHIRDFERLHPDKPTYGLFIAPQLHRDTVNAYWPAVKYEFEGSKQKIVPLTISQFVMILQTLQAVKQAGRTLKHTDLIQLYDRIVALPVHISDATKWLAAIPVVISEWSTQLTA